MKTRLSEGPVMKTGSGLAPTLPAETHQEQDLQALMVRYQQADVHAVAQLVRLLSPRLLRFFAGTPGTRDVAEDALQECWLRIHKARHTYRPGNPVLPWLFAIARHTRVDVWRQAQRSGKFQQVSFDELPAGVCAPTVTALTAIDMDRLLEQLPRSQHEVLYITKVLGMSIDEAARATGSTAGAVKQKLHRAYEKLRRLLAADANAE